MPRSDPWLSDRMTDYARVRRAENELHTAVQAAARDFLTQVAKSVRVPPPAFAAGDGPDLHGFPREGVWQRIVHHRILPVARRLWSSAFSRHAAASEDDSSYTSGLAGRLSGFPGRVLERMRTAVAEGLARSETSAQLTRRVRALATLEEWDGQVMTMTRTETMTALNAGAMAGALAEQRRTGEKWEKRWQSTADDRVRHTHREADGQVRPLDRPFTVGGAPLQFPGDPRGPAGEVINCRCGLRLAPAADTSLTAHASLPSSFRRAPMADHPHHTAPAASATELSPGTPPPIPGEQEVSADGRWRGVLGVMDAWSSDRRMLAAPGDAPVRSRPLPLPLLVQPELANGHDGAQLGVGVIDRLWTDKGLVMGEGRFDMDDPIGAQLARKVDQGFVRFVSLDVDDATAKQVCLDQDGETIREDCDPADPAAQFGQIYTEWRVMGATLLAHPAFPDAHIALAAPRAVAAAAAPGCVAPDDTSDTGWAPAGCDAEGAVPADESGRRPADGEQPQGEEPAKEASAAEGPAGDADLERNDEPPHEPADDSDNAPDGTPAHPTDEQVEEVEQVEDDGNGCVAPGSDGTWEKAPCDAEGAVPANPAGDAPAAEVTDAASEMATTSFHVFADTSLPWADQNREWDGADAADRVAQWASDGDTLDPPRMRRAFLVVDGDPQNKTSYKFGVADVIDGELKLVWKGVVAAGAALNGARTPTTIPTDKKNAAQRAIKTLYNKAAAAFDDDAIRDKATEMATDTDDAPVDTDAGHGCVCPDGDNWTPCDCDTTGARTATEDGRPADETPQHQLSGPPADCAPCRAVAVTAAATRTPADAPGFTPPDAWFREPQLAEPTPITLDPDTGRIAGHLAQWGTCHVGFQDRCITPPSSPTGYEFFHTAQIATDRGALDVGIITMNTGHAGLEDTAFNAVAHYDNTGTQAAVVRVGEDSHGIWVAGTCLPFIDSDERVRLSLASFSGDWRQIRGGMELVAALAVNTPGFPMPGRRTAAGGHEFALVAAGALPPHPSDAEDEPTPRQADTSADAATVASMVIAELDRRDDRHRRQAAASASVVALRQQHHRTRLELARKKIEKATTTTGKATKPRADEPPLELAGLANLPTPSNEDIALAKNWVDKHGGLPPYIKRISKHLTRKGMNKSRAIATAVNVVKKMCATGDTNWPGVQQVNAKSRTQACSAVARWEAMKKAAKAD